MTFTKDNLRDAIKHPVNDEKLPDRMYLFVPTARFVEARVPAKAQFSLHAVHDSRVFLCLERLNDDSCCPDLREK